MPMRLALIVLLAALATPALAQQFTATFTPNPAPQGANVRMDFFVPAPGCGQPVVSALTRTGSAVRVDYVFVSVPGLVCIGTPPPVTDVSLNLGGFPPGQYSVTAFGSDPAFPLIPIPPVNGTLGVFPASNVPVLSPRTALLLALLALLAGVATLAHRRARR